MLGGVVESCVNAVGVDLNTASPSLLKYIAGLTPAVAQAIVRQRETEGQFTSRKQLKKVRGLGGKAFEQCAGFLPDTRRGKYTRLNCNPPRILWRGSKIAQDHGHTAQNVR